MDRFSQIGICCLPAPNAMHNSNCLPCMSCEREGKEKTCVRDREPCSLMEKRSFHKAKISICPAPMKCKKIEDGEEKRN